MTSPDWEQLAKDRGFETPRDMWLELYKDRSLAELAAHLHVSVYTVRLQLATHAVPIRSPGGPNYVKANLADVTEEDIKLKGVKLIAQEHGVDVTTVYKRLFYSKGRHARPAAVPIEAVPAEQKDGE